VWADPPGLRLVTVIVVGEGQTVQAQMEPGLCKAKPQSASVVLAQRGAAFALPAFRGTLALGGLDLPACDRACLALWSISVWASSSVPGCQCWVEPLPRTPAGLLWSSFSLPVFSLAAPQDNEQGEPLV